MDKIAIKRVNERGLEPNKLNIILNKKSKKIMKKIKQFKNLFFFSSGRADLGILIKIADSIKIKNVELILL